MQSLVYHYQRKHKSFRKTSHRTIHNNDTDRTAKLIESATFLFRAAGKRVYVSNNIKPKTQTLQAIADSKRPSKTSRWTEQVAKLFGFPKPSRELCTDSPPWLPIPLNQVTLDPIVEEVGLQPGLTYSHPQTKEKSPQVALNLSKLRESIAIPAYPFPTHLGRLLVYPEKREEIVVDIARSLLDLCGYSVGGRYWTASSRGSKTNTMTSHIGSGSPRIKVLSMPDILLWKNFLVSPGMPEVVGTAFCEIKRDYRYFYWPQIYGELLSVAAARNTAGLFNDDG